MSTDLLSQLAEYGAYHDARQGAASVEDVVRRNAQTRPHHEPQRLSGDSSWRNARVAVLAAVLVLIVVGGMVLLRSDGANPVPFVDQPSIVPADSGPVTPTSLPVIEGGAVTLEKAELGIGAAVDFSRSGDTLWVWGMEGRPAGYRDGAWENLPPLQGGWVDISGTLLSSVLDITGTPDTGVWALTVSPPHHISHPQSQIWRLEDDEWRRVSNLPLSGDAERIEVDEASGLLVWVRTDRSLYSWDGSELIAHGDPPQDMVFDDIAVTADGTVWAARFNPFFPQLPAGLIRYHTDTGDWEWVRPLGGDENVPAVLAPTPDGNLWALLTDHDLESLAVAHFESRTGEWTVYSLPEGEINQWAADDEFVWLTTHGQLVFRLDGSAWTSHMADFMIDNLGIAADGTVWASHATVAGVHQLVFDAEPGVP